MVDLVTQLGFPAATALTMAWFVKYITDRNYEQITTITNRYDEALKNVNEALTSLQIAITALSEQIRHVESHTCNEEEE